MTTNVREPHDRLLTRKQVEARCGLSCTTIYRIMREGLFPDPLKISSKAVVLKEQQP